MKIPQIKVKVTVTKGEEYKVTSPDTMIDLLRKVFNADTFNWTEEMVLVCLNRANVVIGFHKVASGGFSGVVCDPKVIMTIALQSAASGIILAHNHPSGNLKPSQADIDVTTKIHNACGYLDIKLYDHIILTSEGYTSLSELGHI
jgi:DNA repair protein RadC